MTTSFKEFALNPQLQSSLDIMKFETPTPIQALAIPIALEGRDVLGSAQTGTGKTAAFCVPMINFLLNNPAAHALVMLPTRELASQVHDVARKMIGDGVKGPQGIKTALLIGGEPIGKQYAQLDRRPRLIVGTPGRINDHLRGNGDLVDRVAFVVLDEADRMLDMGFAPQIDSILSETALQRQTLMFSATFPDNIVRFTKQYLNDPERVSAGVQSKPGENIVQETVNVDQAGKYDELMTQLEKREGSVIVFVRTQHSADKLSVKLNKDEHTSEAIHGGLRQRQRDKVIQLFRKSAVRILVATDVAARGLDVPHIEHVINYDLPQVAEDYVHRIGRTARAGAKGEAVSFVSPGEKHLWRDIERMLNPGQPDSDKREGGRGGFKKGPPKKDGFKKSGFGGGRKPYAKDGEERSYAPRKDAGKFAPRKEGGRADRKDKRDGGYNPAGDFDRAERPARSEGFAARPPRRDEGADRRPRREEGDASARPFKKPYVKREEGGADRFASNPDSYKRTSSGERREGGFKKPFRQGEASSDRPRQSFGDRPQRSEGGRDERPKRSYGERSERSFGDRPKRTSDDRPQRSENRGDRPQRTEARSTDGARKPFRRDDDRRAEGGERREGGFKKPFRKDGAASDRPQRATAERRDGGRPAGAGRAAGPKREGRPAETRGERPLQRGKGKPAGAGGRSKPRG